jgi:hypothetical protein
MLDINCNRDTKNYVSSDQAHPMNVYSLEHGFWNKASQWTEDCAIELHMH